METDALLELLQDVARRIITPRFRALTPDQVAEKAPGDLVTVADREAEVAITAALRRAAPDALVLGEEAVAADPTLLARASDADHWFTVDPIDGTKNFVNGSADHAVMVAELRGEEVIRGVIWQPAHAVACVAERGAGAWLDGQRLRAAERDPLDPAVRTSIPELEGARLPDGTAWDWTWSCCGVDYPWLAEGRVDALVYGGAMPWDHAPGSLLITETGGALAHPDGTGWRPSSTRAPLLAAGSRPVLERVRSVLA